MLALPPGYIDWGTFCVKDCFWYPFCPSVGISTYGIRYPIPTSDAGLLYKRGSADATSAVDNQEPTEAEYEQLLKIFAKMFAVTLGVSVEEIEAANAEGLTLCQIAESRDLDLDEAWETTKISRQTILQQALDDGSVTQVQAEWISERLTGFDPLETCAQFHGSWIYLPVIFQDSQ